LTFSEHRWNFKGTSISELVRLFSPFGFTNFPVWGAVKGEWSKSVLFLVKPLGLRIQVLGFRDSGFSIEDVSNLKILPAPNLSILGSGFGIKI
jgi:hypothetical protein